MSDLVVAIGLVLVIEGILYAAFADQAKAMMKRMLAAPSATIRTAGLAAAALGVVLIWTIRG